MKSTLLRRALVITALLVPATAFAAPSSPSTTAKGKPHKAHHHHHHVKTAAPAPATKPASK